MQSKLPLFFTVNLTAMAVSSSVTARGDKGDDRKGMKTSESLSPDDLERLVASPIRLDAALAQVFPDMGVRGRRRLWEWCAVMVNGKPRAPGFMVGHGDEVGIVPQDSAHEDVIQSSFVSSGGVSGGVLGGASSGAPVGTSSGAPVGKYCGASCPPDVLSASPSVSSTSSALSDASTVTPPVMFFGSPPLTPLDSSNNSNDLHNLGNSQDRAGNALEEWLKAIQLVAMTPDYLVFYKPCGLHTAHVAGAGSVSLEACLPLFMERYGRNLEAVCLHQGGGVKEGNAEGDSDDRDMHDGASEESPVHLRGAYATLERQSNEKNTVSAFLTKGHAKACSKEHTPFSCPLLLTRLDFETSGLVLAARTPLAQETFRQWELEGKVEKTYLAVAWGKVGKGIVKKALNMKNRRQTAVLDCEGDATRWTAYAGVASFERALFGEAFEGEKETSADATTGASKARNLRGGVALNQPADKAGHGVYDEREVCDEQDVFEGKEGSGELKKIGGQGVFDESKERAVQEDGKEALSLVKVKIHRGARHQIRAHLAFIGYPLLGDALYGGAGGAKGSLSSADLGEEYFYLHYGRLRMPGITAWVLPDNRWARWLAQGWLVQDRQVQDRQVQDRLVQDRQANFYELLMAEG